MRKEKRMTQSELAERAGISLIFLQGIEAERKWISPTTSAAIARAFGTTEARLFAECFETPEPPKAKPKKVSRAQLDHVPEDIVYALATTCRHPKWQWQVFRWILQGYERDL
jgi:transcriptional regulator with XRE-family HTH domain